MSSLILLVVSGIFIIGLILVLPYLFPPKRDHIKLILKNGYMLTKRFRRFPVGRWEFTNMDGTKEIYETNFPQDIVMEGHKGLFGYYVIRQLYYHQGRFRPISFSDSPDTSQINKIMAGVLHDVTLRALLRSKESIMMLVLIGVMALSIGFSIGLISAPHLFGLKP